MKRTWPLVAYLAIVFLAGAAVGALVQQFVLVSSVSAKAPRSPEDFRRAYTEEMRARLNLSPGQVGELGKILDDTRARYREFRERTKPEMKAIQDEQVVRVNKILSASQQVEYAKWRQEREEKRKKMDKNGH